MRARILYLVMAAILVQVGIRGEILDRIAVTVAKQVITESDVIRDVRVSAFLDQKAVDLSGTEKRKAADRLVDQLLILQEIALSRIKLDVDEEVAQRLAQVKMQYAGDAGYQSALVRYRLTEEEVANHEEAGARAKRFTDLRFSPEIEISDDDLRDQYNKLSAEAKANGETQFPTFESSRDSLEKLVFLQRIAQALDRWLGAQRTQTQILYRDQVFK